MRYTLGLHSLLGLLVSLCCSAAIAGDLQKNDLHKALEVAYIDMPPLTYSDEQGQATGILIHKTSQALQKLGVAHRFKAVDLKDFAKITRRADLGLVHLIGAFPVPKKKVSFGDRPLTYLRLNAYFIDAPLIRSRTDLRGKEVILIRGYSYGYLRDYLNFPESRVKLLYAQSHQQALALLREKPDRYLLNYQRPFEFKVGASQVASLSRALLSEIPIYWAAGVNFAQRLSELEEQLP